MSDKTKPLLSPEDLATIERAATGSTPDLTTGTFLSDDDQEAQVKQFAEALGYGSGKVWMACAPIEGKPLEEEAKFAAITGNGPTSKANAWFFSIARRAALGLIHDLGAARFDTDRLQTRYDDLCTLVLNGTSHGFNGEAGPCRTGCPKCYVEAEQKRSRR